MKEFMAVAVVDYYNEVTEKTETENMVLTGVDSYREAMEIFEEYYGNTLEGIHITLLEGPLLKVSSRIVDEIMTGEIENE